MSLTRRPFPVFLACLVVSLSLVPAWIAPSAAAPPDDPVFARFEAWARAQPTGPGATSAPVRDGVALARTRRAVLAALIRSDPRRALELALPSTLRERLPEPVRRHLEQPVAGLGELEVLVVDDFNLTTDTGRVHYLRTLTLDGRSYRAHVYGRRLGLNTKTIPVYGIAVGEDVAIHERPVVPLSDDERAERPSLLADCPGCVPARVGADLRLFPDPAALDQLEQELIAAEETVGPTRAPGDSIEPLSVWTEGDKTVLYMRVDFSDLEGEPVAEATVQNTLDVSTNQFFIDSSYDKTSIKATVTPVLRLPQTAAFYQANGDGGILTDARVAARAAGFETGNFDRDIVAFKKLSFGYSGKARVGAKGVWLNGSFGVGVTSHELGHNWGVRHANFWQTTDGSTIGPGASEEYGNIFDVMGRGGAPRGHFNSWFKSRFDWLTAADFTTVTAGGTYEIQALDDPRSTGIRALKIVKDATRNYWVEFRQRFTSNRFAMNGAVLEWGYNTNRQADLLDTTPGSADGKNDAPIAIGRTFSDREAGIHITPVGKLGSTPEGLGIVVKLGAFPDNRPPSVGLSASETLVARNVPVDLACQATDPDADALAYYWELGDATVAPNSPTINKSWSTAGDKVVRCTVTDMVGGTATQSVTITVTATPTFSISGSVTSDGQPLAGVHLAAATRTALTDASGAYRIVGLPNGAYTVTPEKDDYAFTPASVTVTVSGANLTGRDFIATPLDRVILLAGFDAGPDGFAYVDDAFRGTAQPGYASGAHVASGGFSGGALRVSLGGADDADVTGMSGGWQRSFDLASPAAVTLTLRLKVTQTAEYESDESSEGLLAVDGVLVGAGGGDALARIAGNGNGGSPRTTGFQLHQLDLGTLAAGTHTVTLGGYNSKKTLRNESTEVMIDELMVSLR